MMARGLLIKKPKRGRTCRCINSLLSTSVDKDIIDSANNLKIIANYGAGFIILMSNMQDNKI